MAIFSSYSMSKFQDHINAPGSCPTMPPSVLLLEFSPALKTSLPPVLPVPTNLLKHHSYQATF